MTQPLVLSFSPKRTAIFLLGVVVVLSALHVLVMVAHYQWGELSYLLKDPFDLDAEQSLGTWFSSGILLVCGGLLFAISSNLKRLGTPGHTFWSLLGFGFLVLSLDEVVGLHETLNTVVDYSWTLPGLVVAAVAGLAFIPFIVKLPARTRWLFILAGAIYLGGALGVERATESYLHADLLDTLEYNLTTALEEAMEMIGAIVMIFALLDYAAGTASQEAGLEISAA